MGHARFIRVHCHRDCRSVWSGPGIQPICSGAILAAIAAENEALHAFVEVFAGPARQRADELESDRRAIRSVGPLHGVPIAVKDLARMTGRVPGFGSKCYRGMPEGPTALAIQRLIDAGAIIIGMTHMVEFASGGWGTNYAMGTPWNPIDRQVHRVPGGSSSGSAVAVAAGLAPVAIGSDTAVRSGFRQRSVASLASNPVLGSCRLTGLRLSARPSTHWGPITRTIADARLLASVLAGSAIPVTALARPMRIGMPEAHQLQPCDPEIFAAFLRSVERFRAAGHRVETFTLPMALTDYQALVGQIVAYEAYRHHQPVVEDSQTPMDPFVRERVLAGRGINDAQYAAAKQTLCAAITAFRSEFGHFDLFATPSTPLRQSR